MPRPESRPAIAKARDGATHPAAPVAPPTSSGTPAVRDDVRALRVQHSTRVSVDVLDRLNRYLSTLPRDRQRGLVQQLTERGLVLALDEANAHH